MRGNMNENNRIMGAIYCDISATKSASYEILSYGLDFYELTELTLQGIKTAMTLGYELYEIDDKTIPQENEINIILDGKDNTVCIAKTTRIYVMSFNKVSKNHAFKVGESDRTLDYWRSVHIDYFLKEYADNKRFSLSSL